VLAEIRTMIADIVGEDYVSATDIDLETSFYEDLEIESIEFVALGESLQEAYGDRVDFPGWIATMEIDDIIAITVGALVEHIVTATSAPLSEVAPAGEGAGDG
jgi:acyl carrier protein